VATSAHSILLQKQTLLNFLDPFLGQCEHICKAVTIGSYSLEHLNHTGFEWYIMHHYLLHQIQHSIQQIIYQLRIKVVLACQFIEAGLILVKVKSGLVRVLLILEC
jgi:hypothetical protein